MPATYLIGIDIELKGTKAALFAQDGRCLAEAFSTFGSLTAVAGSCRRSGNQVQSVRDNQDMRAKSAHSAGRDYRQDRN